MIKNYRITVNGSSYDVCVEELAQGSVPMVSAPAPVVAVSPAPKTETPAPKATAPTPATSGKAGGVKVEAPMPGKIVSVKVKVGESVEANQVVAVLEAMKMENEIVTPKAGTVATINVASGVDVNSGDVLITIAE